MRSRRIRKKRKEKDERICIREEWRKNMDKRDRKQRKKM
jgi:hypothetical protein